MIDKSKITLPRIELGKTGIKLSRLALGGFHQVEISSEVVHKVIDAYLEVGGNYIETARDYGSGASEEKIGKALLGRRDQVFLCSKSGDRTSDGIRKDIETSLKLLQTDHIEFYYLHGVSSTEDLNSITAPKGALAGLLKAKEEGLITGIGLSSHRIPIYIEAIRKQLPLSIILVWCNYLEDLYLPEIRNELFPLAKEKGIGITGMKPLADGFLYRSVKNAMQYALGTGAEVVVSGMNSPDHVYQAADAICKGQADGKQIAKILKDAPELGQYVCRQCGKCSDKLMEIFRLEGYCDRQMMDYLPHDPADYALRVRLSKWFSLDEIAIQQFNRLSLDTETLITEAQTVKCPYNIDVSRKIHLALSKLGVGNPDLI
jgi:aryl-alcohol dehydrogenase-like predicted oxidoreductase